MTPTLTPSSLSIRKAGPQISKPQTDVSTADSSVGISKRQELTKVGQVYGCPVFTEEKQAYTITLSTRQSLASGKLSMGEKYLELPTS